MRRARRGLERAKPRSRASLELSSPLESTTGEFQKKAYEAFEASKAATPARHNSALVRQLTADGGRTQQQILDGLT